MLVFEFFNRMKQYKCIKDLFEIGIRENEGHCILMEVTTPSASSISILKLVRGTPQQNHVVTTL